MVPETRMLEDPDPPTRPLRPESDKIKITVLCKQCVAHLLEADNSCVGGCSGNPKTERRVAALCELSSRRLCIVPLCANQASGACLSTPTPLGLRMDRNRSRCFCWCAQRSTGCWLPQTARVRSPDTMDISMEREFGQSTGGQDKIPAANTVGDREYDS